MLTRGMLLVIGNAVHSKSLSASFLADYQEHYEREGKGIFDLMLRDYPSKYFDALVSLAKVHRIELGPPGAFDSGPLPEDEALDRMERAAGPQARQMLELDAIAHLRSDASVQSATASARPSAATPSAVLFVEAVGERRHVTVVFREANEIGATDRGNRKTSTSGADP